MTLTTTPHEGAVGIDDEDWLDGGMPRESYASPWSIASPGREAIVRRQGRLREPFVRTVLEEMIEYIRPISRDG